MNASLLFLDCETTGLDPIEDEVWQVAARVMNNTHNMSDRTWIIKVSPEAKQRLTTIPEKFRRIFAEQYDEQAAVTPEKFAEEFMEFVTTFTSWTSPHLVGAVPSFDDRRVGDLLPERPWDYHLICVENLIAGMLGLYPPYDSNDLSRRVGVDPADYERHTAMGDVEWAYALFRAVIDRQAEQFGDEITHHDTADNLIDENY